MSNRIPDIVWNLTGIALTIASCLVFVSCENDPKDIAALTAERTTVEEARDITSYLSQEGQMKAKLTAPLMYRTLKDTVILEFPKSLHVDFYDDSTRVESTVDALYGKYYETLRKVYLRDSVTVINIQGDTLKAPELWWDQNAEKFYTDKPVRYFTRDKHLFGANGLDAKQDLTEIVFHKATCNLLVNDQDGF
jgi:lipopolysaccharide export system protein LptC